MTIESFDFKTEVKELLDLMIHSLYSHKDIFLRELVSNASDAIDKARYEALTNSRIMEQAGEWKIRISADRENNTLTVSDNGIGMTRDEIVESLGTIAHSGTKEFLTALKGRDASGSPELIGQFGVGFYSAFMVANRVSVTSRKAGREDRKGVKWESKADGSYTVEEIEREKPGTDVVLYLKSDEKQYLDSWEIRQIVRKYSDYIEHPVVMEVEKEQESTIKKGEKIKIKEDETLNSRKALWLKDRAEISDEEYKEFYHHISHDFGDPAKTIHYKAEGTTEFAALLFIPAKAPLGILYKDFKIGPALYVKRVQIMDHCEELLPPYLRFVRGVVDSSDLPLNISREMLQNNRMVETIRKNITKKVLDTLAEMKKNEYDNYVGFSNEFGRVLKEGIHYDYQRREQIADLLIMHSTKTGAEKFTTLQTYLDLMKPEQEDIYYITGASVDEMLKSPYLEAFRHKDFEVLVLSDEIDDIIMASLGEYKGKKLKSVIRGDITLDKSVEGAKEEAEKKYRKLIDAIRERLKDNVKDVRMSSRLRDSACCLVVDEDAIDANMEKVLKAMGQDVPQSKRILEINADHPVIGVMDRLLEEKTGQEALNEYIELLYGQALILEGSKPKDPVYFAKLVSKLMTGKTG